MLVRYVKVWKPSQSLPLQYKRDLPYVIRLPDGTTHRGMCDSTGKWYMIKQLDYRVHEVLRLNSNFEWLDSQVVLNKSDIGMYPKVTRKKRK